MRDMISVASGFQYSVNIGYDLGSDNKLKSFIPTKSALSLLEDILLSVNPTSSDRARVLIGAYGKGKSHIVLTILSILMKRDLTLFEKLMPKIEENPRLYQLVGLTVHINDVLQLFPRFIQKLEILRVGNVCRTAGGIHDEGALVLTGAAAVLIVVIVLIFLWRGSGQQSSNGFRREALPEFHHSGCAKGAFAGVFPHAEEVLQIRILADMPHRPLVAALQSLLDDQRTQCDPGRMCRMPIVDKLHVKCLLRFIPRHQFRQLYPLVDLVQLTIRKYKILDPHLSVHTIHTRILQNCTPFSGFLHYSRAVIIAYFVGKCSDFNAFFVAEWTLLTRNSYLQLNNSSITITTSAVSTS